MLAVQDTEIKMGTISQEPSWTTACVSRLRLCQKTAMLVNQHSENCRKTKLVLSCRWRVRSIVGKLDKNFPFM